MFLSSHIERQTIGFRIPIGTTTVLFSCKTFGTNIESSIVPVIGLIQLKNIESNGLLCFYIPINNNIGTFPNFGPSISLFIHQSLEPSCYSCLRLLLRLKNQLIFWMIGTRNIPSILEESSLHTSIKVMGIFAADPSIIYLTILARSNSLILNIKLTLHICSHFEFCL